MIIDYAMLDGNCGVANIIHRKADLAGDELATR
jgi:hypothetical protein